MDNIQKCECWIGIRYEYENTDLVTLEDLKEHIERHNNSVDFWKKSRVSKNKSNKFRGLLRQAKIDRLNTV